MKQVLQNLRTGELEVAEVPGMMLSATLANNHMFDYGWEGFRQTQQCLADAGIAYLAAGRTLRQAAEPLVLTVKDLTIGIAAYSWEFVQTTCATPDSFGCAPLDHC